MVNKYLKEKRVEAGFTQKELARKLGYTTGQYVSNWERGFCAPPLNAATRITKLLKIPPKKYKQLLVDGFIARLDEIME